MKEYDKYIIPPETETNVATVPYWLFELVRARYRRRLRLLAVFAGVALTVALVWRWLPW